MPKSNHLQSFIIMEKNIEWLKPKEAQALMKVSHNKFYQMVKDGIINVSRPSGRLIYVHRDEVERFFTSGLRKAA